jgi:MATE family multidrug resistance protein
MATAGEQLCGHSVGARDREAFVQSARRVIAWGLGFGLSLTGAMSIWGDASIDFLTTSHDVRQAAKQFMPFATLAPTMGVLAYTFDGIFIGATWARDMRNLMATAFVIYLATWWALQDYGNTGLWIALLTFLGVRGLLQALRYPTLLRAAF